MKLLSICLFALLFFFQAALGYRFAPPGNFGVSRGHGGPGGPGGPQGPGGPGGQGPPPDGTPPAPPTNATSSR